MKKQKSKRVYRQYDDDFKKNAIKMVANGRSVIDVSAALGVSQQNLYEWKKHFGPKVTKEKSDINLVEELRLAEKKIKELEQERDILKKAISIFSRQI